MDLDSHRRQCSGGSLSLARCGGWASCSQAGFTWVWRPLFPRVTATWAGMIAGPALFAIVGYSFFPECMPEHLPTGEERSGAGGILVLSPLAMVVWAGGALWLWAVAPTGAEPHVSFSPLQFAVWSGTIMLALSLIGTLTYTACLR